MSFRRLPTAISLLALLGSGLLGLSPVLHAQKTPTLDEILERLGKNLDRYDKDLPSLFCDEHVVSVIEPSRAEGIGIRSPTRSSA